MNSKVVYLNIYSWVGIGIIEASHYYGRLRCEGHDNDFDGLGVEIKKKLTPREAIHLNQASGYEFLVYEAGDYHPGFEDKDKLIEAAKEVWLDHFPDAEILVLGSPSIAEPQLVLCGPIEVKTKINNMYLECERLNWYDGKDSSLVEEISKEFWRYMKDLGYR